MAEFSFYGHGKLMLTAEYLVLDGAKSLAFPTKKGQLLKVKSESSHSKKLEWKSYSCHGSLWFEVLFDRNFQILYTSDDEKAQTLQQMLLVCIFHNPDFLIEPEYTEVSTYLEFEQNWGLGSSSTLIHCLANWAKIDPFILLKEAFSGSGYDLACANSSKPILYSIENQYPIIESVQFSPSFKDKLWFIHLNKKQISGKEIKKYATLDFDRVKATKKVNSITNQILTCSELNAFNELLTQHEHLLSEYLERPTIKEEHFPDYTFGAIKSLGAWGGDFILATSAEKDELFHYFQSKGYNTIVSFEDMVL